MAASFVRVIACELVRGDCVAEIARRRYYTGSVPRRVMALIVMSHVHILCHVLIASGTSSGVRERIHAGLQQIPYRGFFLLSYET